MKAPAALINTAERFNRMSLRERVLVFAALCAVIIVAADSLLLQPVAQREQALTSELAELNRQIAAAAAVTDATPDATTVAREKEQGLQTALDAINAELASTAAGLVPPEEIVQMLHEVLRRQRGLHLVSLRNEPVRSLLPPLPLADKDAPAQPLRGPFSHPVVVVVEGSYLDVLAYLRELEAMSFRVYWNRLELTTVEYPVNRVRIELSTLSMDQSWLGV